MEYRLFISGMFEGEEIMNSLSTGYELHLREDLVREREKESVGREDLVEI